MTIPLKIKGLLLSVGYCEGQRAVVMPVAWTGRPFVDARAAVASFVAALLAVCKAPAPKEAPFKACCVALRAAKPKAKACPDCGRSFAAKEKRTPDALPEDVLDALWRADIDGWSDALPKWARPNDTGDTSLGGWSFFGGLPADADVVEVDRFEDIFNDRGFCGTEFSVLHVGKRATRASAHGSLTPAEVGVVADAGDDE